MNVLNVEGVTYDIDKLDQAGQISCVLLGRVQGKIQEATMDLDILTASLLQLTDKVKEALTDDAIVEEEDVPTED
tara:strand:- start:628 stop:852 length:225 start_codon:yes stop_codon:yes gene_type:complete